MWKNNLCLILSFALTNLPNAFATNQKLPVETELTAFLVSQAQNYGSMKDWIAATVAEPTRTEALDFLKDQGLGEAAIPDMTFKENTVRLWKAGNTLASFKLATRPFPHIDVKGKIFQPRQKPFAETVHAIEAAMLPTEKSFSTRLEELILPKAEAFIPILLLFAVGAAVVSDQTRACSETESDTFTVCKFESDSTMIKRFYEKQETKGLAMTCDAKKQLVGFTVKGPRAMSYHLTWTPTGDLKEIQEKAGGKQTCRVRFVDKRVKATDGMCAQIEPWDNYHYIFNAPFARLHSCCKNAKCMQEISSLIQATPNTSGPHRNQRRAN